MMMIWPYLLYNSSQIIRKVFEFLLCREYWILVGYITLATLPYLTFGRMPARQTPSAEATTRAQCASPTDLKVERTSLKLWQTSGGDANGYHSVCPMEE